MSKKMVVLLLPSSACIINRKYVLVEQAQIIYIFYSATQRMCVYLLQDALVFS